MVKRRQFFFDTFQIRYCVNQRIAYASAFQYTRQLLSHRYLCSDLFFVNTPMAYKERKGQLIKAGKRKERVDHVADAGVLEDNGAALSGKGGACAYAYALFFSGQRNMLQRGTVCCREERYKPFNTVAGKGAHKINPAPFQYCYEFFFRIAHNTSLRSLSLMFLEMKIGSTSCLLWVSKNLFSPPPVMFRSIVSLFPTLFARTPFIRAATATPAAGEMSIPSVSRKRACAVKTSWFSMP